MRLAVRRRITAARRAELAGLTDDGVAEESVDVTPGTVARIAGLLTGTTGLGTLLASGLVPLAMFACRDDSAAAHARAVLDRCVAVRAAAVALQADSPDGRAAGLRLLVALGAFPEGASAVTGLLDGAPRLAPPRWTPEGIAALPDCAALARAVDAPAAAEPNASDASPGAGIGRLSDRPADSGRVPETGSPRR